MERDYDGNNNSLPLDYENDNDARKIDAWIARLPKYHRRRQDNKNNDGDVHQASRPNKKRPRLMSSPDDNITTMSNVNATATLSSVSSDGWACSSCTFINPPLHLQCNVCGAGNPYNNDATNSTAMIMSGAASSNRRSSEPFSSSRLPEGIQGTLSDKREHAKSKVGRVWSSGGWEWASDPTYKDRSRSGARNDSNQDAENFRAEYKAIKAQGKLPEDTKRHARQTHAAIINLAKKHNILHGKWLILLQSKYFHDDWTKIKNAVLQGKLGPTAKISETPDNKKMHMAIVYCPDFTDKAEVLRIRQVLMSEVQPQLCSFGYSSHSMKPLYFKTDAFTYLEKYRDKESLIDVVGASKEDVKASLGGNSLASLVFGEDNNNKSSQLRTTTYDCGGEHDLNCTTLLMGHADCTNSDECKKCYPRCLGLREDRVLGVVGLQYAQTKGQPGDAVSLGLEPDNEHDSNAVKVMNSRNEKLGYINKTQAKKLAPKLETLQSPLKGTILDDGNYPGSAQLIRVARFF